MGQDPGPEHSHLHRNLARPLGRTGNSLPPYHKALSTWLQAQHLSPGSHRILRWPLVGLRSWICICQLSHSSPTKTHSWEHIRNMSRIFKNVLGMCWEHVRNCGSITLSKLPDTLHVTSRLMNIHSYLRLPISVHCFIFNSWCRCSESVIGKRLT